ncbi:hypothetical protein GCM10007859_06090 [Brevundimonas denitrificans]|uniref:Uncharacterized protein n=1 Tax=Brevundimonas denitrificans TaxID=1443434 RepID=A0ABQ6BHE7_9CAUL|nr:hypothetical protein [Brevundimonas denitrificans]GLS00602.1 hypothetical protein GCM10007859_06090 [Brevundimonas denitrificans]
MSCGVALAVSLLLSDPNVALAAAQPSAAAEAPVSVAGEPLFADIVARSGALKGVVQGWIDTGVMDQADFAAGPAFAGFRTQAVELAALDMQGHVILKERGTDGDLKCILRGIAEDMPLKVEAVRTAVTPAERRVALDELAYLLNDNVEVITAPPQPPV